MARIALTAALLALALALVPVALAGKGKPGGGGTTSGGSSLSLVMVTDLNANGLPNWGDTVTFRVSTSAAYPSVELDCSQNGVLVSQQTAGFYPTYMWSTDYTLKSYYWTGGPANCVATLYTSGRNGSRQTLSTLSFNVGA
jgi:hypothetical protein